MAIGRVPVNTTELEIPFSLTKLMPHKEPYTVSCSATYPGNHFSGLITKFDARGLWTKPFGVGHAADYTPVFPLGSYTSFDDYLARDLSISDDLKARGRAHALSEYPISPVWLRSLIPNRLLEGSIS